MQMCGGPLNARQHEQGLSLGEVLIAGGIVAGAALVAFPTFSHYVARARAAEAAARLSRYGARGPGRGAATAPKDFASTHPHRDRGPAVSDEPE
jgi:Tfp pilus assembly protein FimT